ncbi:hypothetical protein NC653_023578 [Populus alba x Populus x berolinensis]|uniref:Uncharacterized protein n=1 Tax=Populus alba x Populus x berolinensis TaxID=444605 RepID=A0AAD6QCC7_9ROSI|nr:hypothetical protein NC653_023578 [Populus alba x Populus x berolinensis]
MVSKQDDWNISMIFGYAYPAYGCFKVAEKRRTDIEQLLFRCRYCKKSQMLKMESLIVHQVQGESTRKRSPISSSFENGDSDAPQQEVVLKKSVQLKHGRWKPFQSPQKQSNS